MQEVMSLSIGVISIPKKYMNWNLLNWLSFDSKQVFLFFILVFQIER